MATIRKSYRQGDRLVIPLRFTYRNETGNIVPLDITSDAIRIRWLADGLWDLQRDAGITVTNGTNGLASAILDETVTAAFVPGRYLSECKIYNNGPQTVFDAVIIVKRSLIKDAV